MRNHGARGAPRSQLNRNESCFEFQAADCRENDSQYDVCVDIDLSHLRQWIGSAETIEDFAGAAPLRAHRPEARAREFTFRLAKPTFDITPFTLCGAVAEAYKAFNLWVRHGDGALAMNAVATCVC